MPELPPAAFPRLVRLRGWMLILIGPSLCAAMAFLALYLAQTILDDSQHPARPHWHGSHEMTVLTFGLFGTIFLFGLLALVNGVLLLRRGRVGPVSLVLLALIVLTIIGLGYRIATVTPSP